MGIKVEDKEEEEVIFEYLLYIVLYPISKSMDVNIEEV